MEVRATMVAAASGLERAARAVRAAGYLGLDTESNSLHAYRERVCFVQVEAGGHVFVIDTLAVSGLGPLEPLLSDPAVPTVLHGADYDVACLGRDFQVRLGGLFDTMIAAKLLGYEQLGLAALLERHFGLRLDKSMTRHDWGRRPLESRYHRYLVEDVVSLRALQEVLAAELEEEDLVEEAEIEFRRVARMEWSRKEPDPEAFRRIKGTGKLDRRGLSVLKELHELREKLSEKADRPPFKVLGNTQLLQLAARQPGRLADLRRIAGLNVRLVQRHGEALLGAVRRGVEREQQVPLRLKRKGSRPSEEEVAVSEALRAWRRETAARIGRPTIVVLPNPELEAIARTRPATTEDLSRIEDLGRKRLERYGEEILAITRDPPELPRTRRHARQAQARSRGTR